MRIILAATLALTTTACSSGGGGSDTTGPPGGNSAPILASISVTAATPTIIAPNATVQLTAALKDQFGNAFTATVTWASSNTAAATVSSTGLVTGVAQGPANITASSGGVSGAGIVTVVGAGGPGPFPSAADVTMPNNTFSPFVTDIARTGTVRFIFPADAHNVIFTAGTAGAPANIDVLSNTNQSRQFNTAGIFQYFCTLHDGMIAVIVVH